MWPIAQFLRALLLCSVGTVTSLSGAIVSAEYFVGSDPGPGNGVALSMEQIGELSAWLANESYSLIGMSPGIHRLGIRLKDDSERWSNPIFHSFQIIAVEDVIPLPPIFPEKQILEAEFFIGEDPGEGKGTGIVLIPGGSTLFAQLEKQLINLNDLPAGTHRVGVRLKNASGNWGNTLFRSFRIYPVQATVPPEPSSPSKKLRNAEYFVGEDPGPGNGETIPFSEIGRLSAYLEQRVLNIVDPQVGLYSVGVRLQDSEGRWSAAQYRRAMVRSNVYSVPEAPEMPVGTTFNAEYFIGSDPGMGNAAVLVLENGNSFSAAFESVIADISVLEPGVHTVGLRIKDEAGEWSSTQYRRFEVKSAQALAATIARYSEPWVPSDIHTTWEIEFNRIPQNIAYNIQIAGQPLSQWGRIGESSEEFLLRLKTAIEKHPLFAGMLQVKYLYTTGALQLTSLKPGQLRDDFITVDAPLVLTRTIQGFLSEASRAIIAAEYFINDDSGEGRGQSIRLNTTDALASALQLSSTLIDPLLRYDEQRVSLSAILIDFGDDFVWQSARVLNPDERGNYWNSVRPATTYLNLVDTEQQDTGIGMILGPHQGDSYNGPAGDVTVNGPEDSDYDPVALGPFAEDRAVFDYISGIAGSPLGRFYLTGLDPEKTYDITLYGAKKYIQDGGDGITIYRAYKDAAYSELLAETELVVGSTGNTHNRDMLAYLKDLTPDTEGRIYFEFGGKQAWTEGYLNAMSITYGGGRLLFNPRTGGHRVGVRFQNAIGEWSSPIYRSFSVAVEDEIVDTEAPVITLLGEANMDWPYGVPFVEPGFTVVDDVDGDLSDYTKGPEPVNALLLGEHRLLYEAVDSAGNRGTAVRVVTVSDSTPPTIMGFENLQRVASAEAIDYYEGLRVSDGAYGDLTHALRIRAGLVAPQYPGMYSVVFEVRDPAGNISTFIRYYEIIEEGTYPPYATWIADAAAGHATVLDDLLESADPDRDGHSNADEWLAGTDPFLKSSFLALQTVKLGEDVVVQWSGTEGIQYWLEESPDMTNWIQLSTKGVIGNTPQLQRLIDLSKAGNKARFYRLRSEPVGVMEEGVP